MKTSGIGIVHGLVHGWVSSCVQGFKSPMATNIDSSILFSFL